MLTTILHPVYATQGARGFAEGMQHFLPVARRSPTNHVLVGLLVLAPVLAFVGLRSNPSVRRSCSPPSGWPPPSPAPLLVSGRLSEPEYDVMLYWRPDSVSDDWRVARAGWLRFQLDPGSADLAGPALLPHPWYLHLT